VQLGGNASPFEFLRENARRPWIITGYMYSNSILAEDVERLNEEGWLSAAVWARTDTPEHSAQDMLTHQCLVCHTLNGRRGLMKRTEVFDEFMHPPQWNRYCRRAVIPCQNEWARKISCFRGGPQRGAEGS